MGACVAAVALGGVLALAPARDLGRGRLLAAEPYAMRTEATYRIAPDSGTVDVSVTVTFTNTTPNPAGRYSLFASVPIAVQGGASAVTARDATGVLGVSMSTGTGTVATVRLRAALRYQQSATFTLGYRLADDANPSVRVRPAAVVVPVWSFGTSGTVVVHLPSGFTVAVRGEALSTEAAPSEIVLSSGVISDPAHWLALLTATRPADYATVRRSVPLRGGTLDLQVRSWADDAAWGSRILDLLTGALPELQDAIGLPYMGVGPLVVTESLPVGTDQLAEPAQGAQEIAISFDATTFTVLHQSAHIWLGSALIADRWIREGLASRVAARVAADLGAATPYDPGAETAARTSASLPLAAWGVEPADDTGAAADAYGYAASWDTIDRIAAVVGDELLATAVARAATGVGPYDPAAGPAQGSATDASLPLDSRLFLDELEEVTHRDVSTIFRERVLDPADQELLGARSAARAVYTALALAAGGWGAPEPVRSLMTRWQFADAQLAMTDAMAWLRDRNALIARVRAAGLSSPARLEDLWRAHGGDDTARAELKAEQALVDAYQRAVGEVGPSPNLVERLGLLGAPLPTELLARAAGLYANGDLGGSLVLVADAVTSARDAQATGVVRLAIGLAVLAVLAAAATLLLRRRSAPPVMGGL